MEPQDIARDLGRQLAEKQATAPIRTFLRYLSGRGTKETFTKHYKKIMELPYVTRYAHKYPKQMSTFESYVTKALKGNKNLLPGVYDLPARTKGRLALMRALTRGQKAVQAEKLHTLKARLGLTGSVALPTAGTAAMHKEVPKTATASDVTKDVIPAIGAGVAGVSPIVQGLRSGALGIPEATKLRIKDIAQLQKRLKPGDILLTAKPGVESWFKPAIAAIGGDPYGYHVETVLRAPKRGIPTYIESSPASGGAYKSTGLPSGNQDIIIKRFKDPKHVKEFLKNLAARGKEEDVLKKMLGPYVQSKMYDTPAAIKGGLLSFLPKSLQRLLGRGTPLPGATVCSTLPAIASPVCLAPGIPPHAVMPHHIQRSLALKTVGHYRIPRTGALRGLEALFRASPWLIRGALGTGLGYGTYKGLEALT